MAKIILVWNSDPNESEVSKELASKLRINLQDRGHEVSVVKTPKTFTDRFLFKTEGLTDAIEVSRRRDVFLKNLAGYSGKPFVVDVHTTPDEYYWEAYRKEAKFRGWNEPRRAERLTEKLRTQVKFWQARIIGSHILFKRPIMGIIPSDSFEISSRVCTIEMPAKYRSAQDIDSRLVGTGLHHYFESIADLKATKAANYLSPKVIQKFGHLIDTEVNTVLGKYRKPRRHAFKRRQSTRRKK